jgi:hypothetical protein
LIISGETASKCLDRASIKAVTSISKGRARNHVEKDILSANRLIEIARQRGFEARLAHLDWKGLQAAASADPVLLLLRNGNTVLALRNGGDAFDQIVVSDPLYIKGEEFLLPRNAIEPAWDGDAVIIRQAPVRQAPVTERGKTRLFIWGLVLCTVAAAFGLLLFYPREAEKSAHSLAATMPISGSDMALDNDLTVTRSAPAIDAVITSIRAQLSVKEPDGTLAEQSPAAQQILAAEPNVRASSAIIEIESAPINGEPSPPKTDPPQASSLANVVAAEPSPPSASTAESSPSVAPNATLPSERSTPAQIRIDTRQTAAPVDALSSDEAVPTVTPANSVLVSKGDVAEKLESRSLTESRRAMDTVALVVRGDMLFGTGDITSARHFYERAADAGNGQAALRLGESYDPSFLEQAHLRAVRGDTAVAIQWYKRARELGASEADVLLMSIEVK